MRRGSAAVSESATLPHGRSGSPCPSSRSQVSPPSLLRKMPEPGPPLSRPQVHIRICHIPANSSAGFAGLITTSEAPVFSSTNSTRSQVSPPSLVRKIPRSSCGP